MNSIITLAALAALAQAPSDPPAALDGNWIVVAFEKRGMAQAEGKDCMATIKENVISFMPKNEKASINAMKLEFGPRSSMKVTEVVPKVEEAGPPKARDGVYVLSGDYLAVSIQHGPAAPEGTAPAVDPAKPNSTAFCTVILKRVPPPERK